MAIGNIATILNKKPEMREIAISQVMDMYKHWELTPYNPDELITKKGYKAIKKMMTDGHVKGCINTLKMATLGSGWEILPANDKDPAKEHADFANYCVDSMVGSFYDDLLNILNGLENGWSVSEKNFKMIERGRWKGKVGLASIKDKDPEEYKPSTDSFGNLTELVNIGKMSKDYGKKYPIDKFIIHTFWKKYENVFGESVLRAVYRHWWSKDNIIKFWNIFLNKFGMPTVVAKYKRGVPEKEQQRIIELLKTIQTETGVTIPDDFELDLLEAMRRGDAGYEKALNFHNAEMSKAIFGQTLTAEQGNIGSRALGAVHFDILIFYVEQLQRIVENVTDEQLIRQLIDYNFANVDEYPYMQMKSIVEEDKQKQVELFIDAFKDKVVAQSTIDDENHIRDLLNFEDRKLTDREKQIIEDGAKRKEKEEELPEEEPTGEEGGEGEGEEESEKFEEYKKPYRQLTSYEEKVNYEEVFNVLEDSQRITVDKLAVIVRKQLDDLEYKIERRKLVEPETPMREIDKLEMMYLRDMRTVFRESSQNVYGEGMNQVKKEVNRERQKYAAPELKIIPMEPKEMLKYFEAKAFWVTGIVRDDILKITKGRIYNARKTGKTLKQTIHLIEEDMKQYMKVGGLLTPDKDGVVRIHTPARLETIVRTNTSEAYSEGRRAEMVAMGDDVPAIMYSAILDNRTRPEHAKMDGRIYAKDDPIWDIWMPPNGYSCRCIPVPVLKEEEYQISKKIAAKPDKGFE